MTTPESSNPIVNRLCELIRCADSLKIKEDLVTLIFTVNSPDAEQVHYFEAMQSVDEDSHDIVIPSEIHTGQAFNFEISPYTQSNLFASYASLIKEKLGKTIDINSLDIYEHIWRLEDTKRQPVDLFFLQSLFDFVAVLKQSFEWGGKLALSYKNQLSELVIDSGNTEAILRFVRENKNNDAVIDAMANITAYLNADNDKHLAEKKAIVSDVLTEQYAKNNQVSLSSILDDIINCHRHINGKYRLYMENYKYGDFVEKLADNSEKIIEQVNNVLSKTQIQVLVLPIITAFVSLSRTSLQTHNYSNIVWVALIAYAVVVFINLIEQCKLLHYLKKKVQRFEVVGRVPKALEVEWQQDKSFILNRLQWQFTLACLFFCVVTSVFFYCLYQIFPDF